MEQGIVTSNERKSALIAVGSNQDSIWGSAGKTVMQSVRVLEDALGRKARVSRLYRTPAFPAGAGPDFVNAALCIESGQSADAVLAVLHDIEAQAARVREVRWGPRTLDLDLIGFDQLVLPDLATFRRWHDLNPEDQQKYAPQTLILPHPRLQDRAFVLVPLAEVAPDWVHPVSGRSVSLMLSALPQADRDAVVPLG